MAKKKANSTTNKTSNAKTTVTTSKVESVNMKRTALFAVAAVVMAYAFASWAIDSGSLWMYLFTYISVYFAVTYSWRLLRTYINS